MTSTERDLRVTIAALLHATGERHRDLATGIGIGRDQVSRKQAAVRSWSIKDLHHLAVHYEMTPADLLCGADHAVRRLPAQRRADSVVGTRTAVTLPRGETPL